MAIPQSPAQPQSEGEPGRRHRDGSSRPSLGQVAPPQVQSFRVGSPPAPWERQGAPQVHRTPRVPTRRPGPETLGLQAGVARQPAEPLASQLTPLPVPASPPVRGDGLKRGSGMGWDRWSTGRLGSFEKDQSVFFPWEFRHMAGPWRPLDSWSAPASEARCLPGLNHQP